MRDTKSWLAKRISNLGTETAFAVSMEAAELGKNGLRIYPFHLGDMNIGTPENIMDAAKTALDRGKTGYCPPAGITELREALAESVGESRGLELGPGNVSVQPGGKPVIGKFIQVLMDPGDEVLYPSPGYPIYESMIDYFGGAGRPYGFRNGGEEVSVDTGQIESQVTPKSRILIYNNHQNPTGAESDMEEMEAIARVCRKHNLYLLSDEAYFDVVYEGKGRSIASLPGMPERTVILYTFSKTFAMTGWRLGAAIGPEEIIEPISKLNVNYESCTSHFIQWAGVEALKNPQNGGVLETLRERRQAAMDVLDTIPGFLTLKPNSTFYLFPDVTEAMENMGIDDVEEFRKNTLCDTGVSFCTRNHFGAALPGETRKYIRVAYSGLDTEDITEGLTRLKHYVSGNGR